MSLYSAVYIFAWLIAGLQANASGPCLQWLRARALLVQLRAPWLLVCARALPDCFFYLRRPAGQHQRPGSGPAAAAGQRRQVGPPRRRLWPARPRGGAGGAGRHRRGTSLVLSLYMCVSPGGGGFGELAAALHACCLLVGPVLVLLPLFVCSMRRIGGIISLRCLSRLHHATVRPHPLDPAPNSPLHPRRWTLPPWIPS